MLLIVVAVLALLSYGLFRLRQQRKMFKDLPGPPHHAIWGHFLIMRDIAGGLPHDATPQLFAHLMRQKYGLGDFFYLDLWPLAPPQLVVVEPEIASQVTQKMNLPKETDVMSKWTGHILGKKSMVTANGHDWLVARKSFVPGFQPRKVLQHVPAIVDDAMDFCNILKDKARTGEVFKMEDLCARMIFNISAQAILYVPPPPSSLFTGISIQKTNKDRQIDCNAQRDDDEFLELFRKQASLAPQDFWSRYLYDISPSRHYQKWKHGRALDRYVGRIVDERISNAPAVDEKGKSMSYFAIDDAIAVNRQKNASNDRAAPLDKDTREMLITSVKTLIFAAHDTSASTICYTYAALSKHPEILQRVRAEHDEVFGKEPARAAQLLQEDPNLVNNLPYTLAIIKEALRLWPPTGISLRSGRPDQTIKAADGKAYPTFPFAVLVNNCATMRREDLFRDADRFFPDRHLVTDPEDPYFVPKDAWRPFEKGPRACLGQTLALVQLKIILLMTLREFDMETVYEDGRYMYQVLDVTAKPSWGLPTKVHVRDNC